MEDTLITGLMECSYSWISEKERERFKQDYYNTETAIKEIKQTMTPAMFQGKYENNEEFNRIRQYNKLMKHYTKLKHHLTRLSRLK